MKKVQNITLQNDRAYAISDHLYGIFLEDIGFAVDGGLNANLIHNYSFDGVYLDLKTNKPLLDPLRYWHLSGGTIKSMEEGGLAGHSRYARITVSADETAVLRNYGYHGGQKGERPAINNVSGIPAKESEGCGEMLKNDAPEAKNRLQFTGEAKNEVLPQQICCHVSEGEMELTLHSHSIIAVAITV